MKNEKKIPSFIFFNNSNNNDRFLILRILKEIEEISYFYPYRVPLFIDIYYKPFFESIYKNFSFYKINRNYYFFYWFFIWFIISFILFYLLIL